MRLPLGPGQPLRGFRDDKIIEARALALAEARLWLGTPYRHQASRRGAGCDCLGLVRGVWRALYGDEPEPAPPYRPDWAELGEREILLQALGRWLVPLDLEAAGPGDVLVFRIAPGAVAKHCAIVSGPGRMIHAYWGRACVESWLGPWWRTRLAAAFRFPCRAPSPLAGEGGTRREAVGG
ncbi:MAG: C40 family peptidase [Alphaproteobacteria bacterium]|nr:C40 family peptidase [Alphaproteobacteria bacterium]